MMADPAPFKNRRFSLYAAILLLALVAALIAWYTVRYRTMRHAAELLQRNGVVFHSADAVELPWYDRLPWLDPPARIESVMIGPHTDTDLETLVPVLNRLGTVTTLDYDNLSVDELRLLSRIKSIETIQTRFGLTAEEVRPFLSHKLRNVAAFGPDYNIPEDSLELLFSIPTLERIGTAHGASAVPESLKAKRPDVSIDITDFPP